MAGLNSRAAGAPRNTGHDPVDGGGAAGFPAPGHDHAACRDTAIARAEGLCARRGARLTPQRREVLDLLLSAHRALGAYEIMDAIDWEGRKPAPVVVYRALDFLMELGLVHRLASLNAYVACGHGGDGHETAEGTRFLICTECRTVAEITGPGIAEAVQNEAARTGFAVEQMMIEVSGTCPHCADAGAGSSHG